MAWQGICVFIDGETSGYKKLEFSEFVGQILTSDPLEQKSLFIYLMRLNRIRIIIAKFDV